MLFLISTPLSSGFMLVEVSAVPDLICLEDFDGLGVWALCGCCAGDFVKLAFIDG
jgi:hypothetical protein